jgi:hypothetical protein
MWISREEYIEATVRTVGREIRQKVGWLLSDDLSVDNGGDELSSLSVA